jgi:hypothetical protein
MPESDERNQRQFWMRLGLGFAIWTLAGVMDATHSYFKYAARNDPLTWPQALGMGLSLWYAWALLSLLIFPFCRRFPLEQRNWPRRVALHVAAAVVFALVKLVMDYPIIKTFYCPMPHLLTFPLFYRMALLSHFEPYVFICCALMGISHALNYYRKYQERGLKTAHLEARLARTHLQLLKTQLRPHFLLNTLNAVSALIHLDAEAAERALARLGDLLRLILEHDGIQEVPLEEELAFLQAYLEIEEIRFGPRLRVGMHVAPEARGASVPYLLLQPLVENAIRHGIAARDQAGHLAIRAGRANGVLRLQVEDDGPGLRAKPDTLRQGVGLANTRARLQQLYGDDHRFELGNRPGGGVQVLVEIPFRAEEGTANGHHADTSNGMSRQPVSD